jgi:hypothetical protein
MKYWYVFLCVFIISCNKEITQQVVTPVVQLTVSQDNTFKGYKVDPNARQLGFEYWYHGTGVMSDLITAIYQKPYGDRIKYGTFFNGVVCGDFNNDGWIDVFNAGVNYNGVQANFTFLIWDTISKTFNERNLFNDKSFTSFGGNKHTIKPYYLNDDNYIDLVIFDGGDEVIPNSPDEPVRIVLSDGKGGYDLKSIATSENESPIWKKEKGSIGDLNGDGLPDLVLPENMFMYIYWGVKDYPFFTQTNRAKFVGDFNNFGNQSNNSFGEKVPNIAGNLYTTFIYDMNNDGINDIVGGVGESHSDNRMSKVLLNQGSGRFNQQSIVNLPFFYNDDNINVGIQDVLIDDVNGDGLKDIIAVNDQSTNTWLPYEIYVYVQQKDGSYLIDKTYIQYSTVGVRKGNWKPRLMYYDFNKDGKKDISYLDDADNGELKNKTVFIRTGNKFIEEDFYQFDSYSSSIKSKLK